MCVMYVIYIHIHTYMCVSVYINIKDILSKLNEKMPNKQNVHMAFTWQ